MANESFVKVLREMAFLAELNGENPFKIRALENSARILEDQKSISELVATGEIQSISGIGKGTQAFAKEFVEKESVQEHEDLKKEFPSSIFELLTVRGLGPKKIKSLYEQLQIASLVDLEYACHENRLLDLKGFGEKTQKNILNSLEELKMNRGKLILPAALQEAENQIEEWKSIKGLKICQESGELRRRCEVISQLDFVLVGDNLKAQIEKKGFSKKNNYFVGSTSHGFPVHIYLCEQKEFSNTLFTSTGPDAFVHDFHLQSSSSEEEIFQKNKKPYLPPECRDLAIYPKTTTSKLIEEKDIRGVFHFHTNWSDGANSLEDMVREAIKLGYEYIGVSDHSQSAFYANGLNEKRIAQQKKEIEGLQKQYQIRIFHGIESDILPNGELDYSPTTLKQFDFVIASIHGQMKMGEKEMTQRLIKALKNPATTWLGHWSGRLLLGRKGYSFQQEEVLKVAASEGKGIELNSNPYRLDIDWRILPRVMELKIPVGIFPDAHSVRGFHDLRYGIWMARKAGMSAHQVSNTMPLKEMEAWLRK